MSAFNERPNAENLPVSGAAGAIVEGRYLPPPEDKDGKLWVRTCALVQRNCDELYAHVAQCGSSPDMARTNQTSRADWQPHHLTG